MALVALCGCSDKDKASNGKTIDKEVEKSVEEPDPPVIVSEEYANLHGRAMPVKTIYCYSIRSLRGETVFEDCFRNEIECARS